MYKIPPTNFPRELGGRRLSWRVAFVLGGASLLLMLAGATFWYQDLRYSLPTPRPAGWQEVSRGQTVSLPPCLAATHDDHRPLLLHFFNPDCPCSRFNSDHVRTLRQRFGNSVRFVAVVQVVDGRQADARDRGLKAAGRLFGPGTEAIVDEDGAIAAACGVYSTPQAAILTGDSARMLIFRGNYNTARYCTDPGTEFVRLALESLINGQSLPAPTRDAMVAYGCELPANVATAHLVAPDRHAAKL